VKTLDITKYEELANRSFATKFGKIVKVVGLTLESIGPDANINDVCVIVTQDKKHEIYAEVVGFKESRVLLMPIGNIEGIGVGSMVYCTKDCFKVPVGDELLGKILDGVGKPLNGEELNLAEAYSVDDLAKGIHWALSEGKSQVSPQDMRDEVVHRYSSDVVAQQYLTLYKTILNKG
jgi:flagellum-specific ATP synthase